METTTGEISQTANSMTEGTPQNDEGEIEFDIDGNSFNFQWAELAPPSGVVAANY